MQITEKALLAALATRLPGWDIRVSELDYGFSLAAVGAPPGGPSTLCVLYATDCRAFEWVADDVAACLMRHDSDGSVMMREFTALFMRVPRAYIIATEVFDHGAKIGLMLTLPNGKRHAVKIPRHPTNLERLTAHAALRAWAAKNDDGPFDD